LKFTRRGRIAIAEGIITYGVWGGLKNGVTGVTGVTNYINLLNLLAIFSVTQQPKL
jgi:hypothetical protein